MSSHFSRLREELDARQSELHEKEATVESIKKLTQELEAQKRALVAKSAELDDHQKEVKRMQTRLDALVAAEPAIASAMSTKSSTTDVVRHVVECAIRSDHLTGSDIVRLALGVAMQVNGRTRGDNIDDILIDLIDDEQGLKAAIESAMANFAGVKDVVKCALDTALEHGASDEDLTEVVAKTVFDMLGNKASPKPIKETPIGTVTTPPDCTHSS
jgi:myosin heavy subunit